MCCERRLSVWTVCLLLSGCAHTAVVQRWEPAAGEVADVQRVTVAEFQGASGQLVAAALKARLGTSEACTLVESSELGQVIPAAGLPPPGQSLEGVLRQARAAGVDGVIVGDVVEFQCRDRDVREHHGAAGRPAALFASGAPRHVREGSVTVDFRLIDANTGNVLLTKRASQRFDSRAREGGDALPAPDAVLEALLSDCADDFVALLGPQHMATDVELAVPEWFEAGALDVRRGNRLAGRGRWDQAEQAWQAARDRNPQSDAALFNLGLAAAQRADYSAAEDYAMQALRLVHTDCYAQGLEQIRQFRADHDKAERQRTSPVVPAAYAAWR
jgi:hypothetical protein